MSDKCPPLLDNRQSSTSSIQSNTSTGGAERDTSSNDELQHQQQQQQQHQKSAHHHHQQHQRTHKKQFVVGGAHSRHHTRVPSYGRNLNKLGKLTPLGTSPVKGAGSEKLKGGRKKLAFEVSEGGGEEGYEGEEGQELIEGEEEEVEVEVVPDESASGGGGLVTSGGPVVGGASTQGLAKSPSTKSLDPQPREGVRRKPNPTSRRAGAGEDSNGNNKRDRSRSKSREGRRNRKITASSRQVSTDKLVEMNSGRSAGGGGGGDAPSTTITSPSQQLQQKQKQPPTSQPVPAQSISQSLIQPQNGGNPNANTQPPTAKELHTHLLPHTKPPSAIIPPQVNHESISTHTKIHHTPPPPNAPITPAHSLPNSHDQPLTSRFIDFSNSQGGTSTSISPSSGGGARRSGNPGGGDGAPQSATAPFSTPNPNNSSSAPKAPTNPPSTAPITTAPTAIAAKPSRTQQKLWLQRQSSQHEPPMAIPPHAYLSQTAYQNPPTHPQSHHHTYHPVSTSHHHSSSAPLSIPLSCAAHPARLTKEFERVNREYLNTRRFMNPILDSLERTAAGRNLDRRIPRRGHTTDASGNTMGLSQSLKETGSLKVGGVRGGGSVGVKDDSAVARQSIAERGRERERGGDLHALLMRIWKEGELLVSNE